MPIPHDLTEATRLIEILVIFSNAEKDHMIADLPQMPEAAFTDLLNRLRRAKQKQDTIVAQLPPEQSRTLSHALDTASANIRQQAEAKISQEEEKLLQNIAEQIASL